MKKLLEVLKRKNDEKIKTTEKKDNNEKLKNIGTVEIIKPNDKNNNQIEVDRMGSKTGKHLKQDEPDVKGSVLKNGKHLICDDSDSNRMVLSKYLTRKNYLVDEAINGQEAIEKISNNGEYFIVWMDIMMPRMNGLECTDQLRKKYNYKGVIIGLTGFIDQESVNECLKRGMNHVIGKPIDKVILYHYAEIYTNKQPIKTDEKNQIDKKEVEKNQVEKNQVEKKEEEKKEADNVIKN